MNRMEKRVEDLFRSRRIHELIHDASPSGNTDLNLQLRNLQKSIYQLDHYLETTWSLKKGELNGYWRNIMQNLTPFEPDKSLREALVSQIHKYESYEIDLRTGRLPIRLSFRYWYYYKSCDVKLIRKLLYQTDPQLEEQIRQQDWLYFDLISEIEDDVHDLFEDCRTFNCNRFLISIWKKGSQRTRDDYFAYLEKLDSKFQDHVVARGGSFKVKGLFRSVSQQIRTTRKQIDKQLNQLSKIKEIKNCELAKKLA